MTQEPEDPIESALLAEIVEQRGPGGDPAARLAAYRALLARAEARGDAAMAVRLMHGEALALSEGGRMEEAEARYREARVRAEALPDRGLRSKARRELGMFLSELGRSDEARVALVAACAGRWEAFEAAVGDHEKNATYLAWGRALGELGAAHQTWGRRAAPDFLDHAMRILPAMLPDWATFAAHRAGVAKGLASCDDACSRLAVALRRLVAPLQDTAELNFAAGELPEATVELGPEAEIHVRVTHPEGVEATKQARAADFLEIVLAKGLPDLVPALGEASAADLDEIRVEATLFGGFRVIPRLRGETPAALQPLLCFAVSALLGLLERRTDGTRDFELLTAFARMLADAGEHAAAEPLYRVLYAVCFRQHGLDASTTLYNLMQLGFVLWSQDKLDEAGDAFRRVLPVLERRQGRSGRDTLVCAFNLGAVRHMAGDYSEALAIYRDVRERRRSARAPEPQDEVAPLQGEARALLDLGRHEEADAMARECLARARAAGDQQAEIPPLHVMARVARERGDVEEALARCEEALARAGGDARYEHACHLRRAEARSGKGDHAGAEEDCRRSLALVARLPERRWQTHAMHARVLRAAGRVVEARAAIDEALATRPARSTPADEAFVYEELAEIEAVEGRRDDAARRLADVHAFHVGACGEESPPARRLAARIAALRGA